MLLRRHGVGSEPWERSGEAATKARSSGTVATPSTPHSHN